MPSKATAAFPYVRAKLGVALMALISVAGSFIYAATDRSPQMCMLHSARALGWVATVALLLTLSISPAARMASAWGAKISPRTAQLRRTLGMTTAWLALLHSVISYFAAVHPQAWLLWYWPHLHFGALALAILLLLLATSFPAVVKVSRLRAWKELHRLAYLAAAFTFLHAALSTWAPRALLAGLFGIWIVSKSAAWLTGRLKRATR